MVGRDNVALFSSFTERTIQNRTFVKTSPLALFPRRNALMLIFSSRAFPFENRANG